MAGAMGTLPERIAQRLSSRKPRLLDPGLRSAALLAPVVGERGNYRLLLTRRSRDLRRQPGDIAFPGGMVDPEDGSELAAALREAQEEIGLDPDSVRVLGRLDDRLTIQGFRLSSFVGWIRSAEGVRVGPEVESVFEVPLKALPLCESTAIHRPTDKEAASGGPAAASRVIFRYRYEGRDIWGLTARIIRDLLDVSGP